MKKLLAFLFIFGMFFVVPIVLIAQTGEDPTVEAQTLSDYVTTFTIYAASCIAASTFLLKALATKMELPGWLKYTISAAVALGIGLLAYFLQMGIFAVPFSQAILFILGGFLMSAGIFKLPIVEGIIGWLGGLAPKVTNK